MKKIFLIFIIVLLIAAGYTVFDNNRVVTTKYSVSSDKIPPEFNGYKIALLTDFHNESCYKKVIKKMKAQKPDIICIAGDIVNMNTTDYTNTEELLRGLTPIAPVYYVYGNHEQNNMILNNYDKPEIYNILCDYGVTILENENVVLEKSGAKINLTGYMDNNFDDTNTYFKEKAKRELTSISKSFDSSLYTICLIHRGQYFDYLSEMPYYDLYLSGHLHGGLINIGPIRDMILEKHVGTSKYSKGMYTENGKTEIISAGIANDDGIPRILNTPEIVIAELLTK
ncbi:MAG: metallophosphoesterase [Clostridiales bacterium]|nr:metallophosphoesterase [Clostridiales bacterium]